MNTMYKNAIEDKLQIVFTIVTKEDFESLVALRIAAMRESLERVGRFDPIRARERLSSGFKVEYARHIFANGVHAGFFVVKQSDQAFLLEHLYIHPDYQGRGIGAIVIKNIIGQADALNLPIKVSALKESRSNGFYQYHGFVVVSQDELSVSYIRPTGIEV
ncbi:GNAT family N-acetyltransferase [Glaciimonas sp. GG7]